MTTDTQDPAVPGSNFAIVVAPRDIAAAAAATTVAEQSKLAFDDVAKQLEARGMSFSDIVKTRLLYSSRSDFPEMNTIRDPLYRSTFDDGNFPAASGVVTGGRGRSPRFELEVIAVTGSKRQNTDSVVSRWGSVVPPFSHSQISSQLLAVSGQGPAADGGTTLDPSIGGQAHRALEAVGEVLAASGRSALDVISLNLYLTPVGQADFAAAAAEVTAFLAGRVHPPVVTVIGVADLAFDGMDVEVEAMTGDPAAPSAWSRGANRGGLIPSSAAARQGDLVSASVRVEGAPGTSDLVALLGEAKAAAVTALADVDASIDAPDVIVTVWFTPAASRDLIEAAVASLGARTVSLQPVTEIAENPVVMLEVFGRVPS